MRPRAFTVVVAYAFRWIAIVVGLILLVVPAGWTLCRWFAISLVPLGEPGNLRSAFQRSRVLARGATGFLIGTVLASEVVWVTVFLLVYTLVSPGWVTSTVSPAANLLGWILSLVFLPPRMAVYVLVYGARRRAREALDLEQAVASL
ncbi:MAG: hypothetical protein Q8K82_11360 [Gemmatimonadaceae bacterium]|nr:hypothetical protein [Gemmatimonadaceae bacterium]